jgi:hypothetical protein
MRRICIGLIAVLIASTAGAQGNLKTWFTKAPVVRLILSGRKRSARFRPSFSLDPLREMPA